MENHSEINEKHTKELYDRIYQLGDVIEGSFIETLDQESLLKQYERYFNRGADRELQSLLSIDMGLYEKIFLLDYPKDTLLLEAYDLLDMESMVLGNFVVSSVADANLYTDHKGYEKLISLSGNDGGIHFILENEWDEVNKKFKIKIRFSIHAMMAIQWNKFSNKGEGAYLVRFSLRRNELTRNLNVS